MPLFAPLLSLPVPENRYPPLNLSPSVNAKRPWKPLSPSSWNLLNISLSSLSWKTCTGQTRQPSELLNLLIDQTPTASLLVLLTCRPHFQPAWHHRSYLTEITVNRLSHAQVEQIVTGMTDGKTFPAEVLQQIIAKTDGVPFFVEEMTKAILESGHLKAVDGHYELTGSFSTFAIPATLQDSLMARLDRLVTAKAVAQYAAVIGRQFSYDLLSMVSQLDDATLQRELGRLVEAEIVYQRGLPPQATYTFKHALIQDAAYESLLKSTRQQYHQRIAQVLEPSFPRPLRPSPNCWRIITPRRGSQSTGYPYWQKAGQRAIERSAYVEALAHLTARLAVLQLLPDTPERVQQQNWTCRSPWAQC